MKKVVITVFSIQIILIAVLLIYYNNNITKLELKPRPNAEVSHFSQPGVSSRVLDGDYSKKGIVLRFKVQNNSDEDYHFHVDNIYLQIQEEKIFKSDLEEESVKLDRLTSQAIEPNAKIYGYRIYIVPRETENESLN